MSITCRRIGHLNSKCAKVAANRTKTRPVKKSRRWPVMDSNYVYVILRCQMEPLMAFRVRVAAASISGAVFVNRRNLQQQKTK